MPKLLVDEADFRIVADVVGEADVYTLEVRDGADALGVERWRTFNTSSKDLRSIFAFLIRVAQKQEQ